MQPLRHDYAEPLVVFGRRPGLQERLSVLAKQAGLTVAPIALSLAAVTSGAASAPSFYRFVHGSPAAERHIGSHPPALEAIDELQVRYGVKTSLTSPDDGSSRESAGLFASTQGVASARASLSVAGECEVIAPFPRPDEISRVEKAMLPHHTGALFGGIATAADIETFIAVHELAHCADWGQSHAQLDPLTRAPQHPQLVAYEAYLLEARADIAASAWALSQGKRDMVLAWAAARAVSLGSHEPTHFTTHSILKLVADFDEGNVTLPEPGDVLAFSERFRNQDGAVLSFRQFQALSTATSPTLTTPPEADSSFHRAVAEMVAIAAETYEVSSKHLASRGVTREDDPMASRFKAMREDPELWASGVIAAARLAAFASAAAPQAPDQFLGKSAPAHASIEQHNQNLAMIRPRNQ